LIFFIISIIHILILSIFNENIINSLNILRFVVIFKVLVLAINIIIMTYYIKSKEVMNICIRYTIIFMNIALICYLIQVVVFACGVLPYGSFSPAGWTKSIIPSFGSVSIERGHFGKFSVPLFPLYMYAYKQLNYKKSLLLFLLVSLLNISASAYMFLIAYLLSAFIILRKQIGSLIITGVLLFLIIISFIFHDQIAGMFLKVYQLGIIQDDSGGRKFSLLWEILSKYPFGYGYGGSTFRDLHGINNLQLNNAIVAYFGQLSVLGIFTYCIFIFSLFRIYKSSKVLKKSYDFERKLLFMSLLVMIFVFASDVLWFVPVIWLPVVMFMNLSSIEKRNIALNLN